MFTFFLDASRTPHRPDTRAHHLLKVSVVVVPYDINKDDPYDMKTFFTT